MKRISCGVTVALLATGGVMLWQRPLDSADDVAAVAKVPRQSRY